jgi:hypothetical protein
MCHVPPHVELFSSAGFWDFEVTADAPVYYAGVDIRHAFHQHALDEWLCDNFCLEPVRAGDVGLLQLNGALLATSDWVYPQVCLCPMGWSWAVALVQQAHLNVLARAGVLGESREANDVCALPLLSEGPVHSLYIDNLNVMGHDPVVVNRLRRRATEAFEADGLSTHDIVDACTDMDMF